MNKKNNNKKQTFLLNLRVPERAKGYADYDPREVMVYEKKKKLVKLY